MVPDYLLGNKWEYSFSHIFSKPEHVTLKTFLTIWGIKVMKTYFALICVFPSNNEGKHFIGHVDFLLLEWPFHTSFSFFSWAFICLLFTIYRNSLYTWHIFPFTIVWFANIFLVNDLSFFFVYGNFRHRSFTN